MAWIIVGLGNAGKEYEKTRHNAGRRAVERMADEEKIIFKKNAQALFAKGSIATYVLPETMMNNSGKAVTPFVKSVAAAKKLIVIHDDLDLPLGTTKMVFGRGSGGHKGVESIMRALKTNNFFRIRIGISGVGKKHQAKKVVGEEKVIRHVIGTFTSAEEATLRKVLEKVSETVHLALGEKGSEAAMQFANTH
jgi:PTH1 family peptidyl-tRNA hydrolase